MWAERCDLVKSRQKHGPAGLARIVARKMAGERLKEFLIVQPSAYLLSDELAHVLGSLTDLVEQLRACVDDGNKVLHIVMKEITFAAPKK
jgi:hypothetical protein